MKVPELLLSHSAYGKRYVDFLASNRDVSGTAIRMSGQNESHYTISDLAIVPADTPLRMSGSASEPGTFNVVANTTFGFDDGVVIATVHGFEFWIDPDQGAIGLSVGVRVSFLVRNFTLYVGYLPGEPQTA